MHIILSHNFRNIHDTLIKSIISLFSALWKEEIKAKQQILLSHDRMKVREEMFSPKARIGAVSALKNKNSINCGSEDDNIFGITGNFRKLEVD